MPEVEILLGTRNGTPHLGAQFASFAGQSMPDWTLLVSDDGSTDRTRDMLERFGAARPGANLRVISGPQRGISANYLHLLEQADRDAPFIALSDQDDIWFPEKLRRGVNALRRLPRTQPAIYAAQSRLIDSCGRPIARHQRRKVAASFPNALVQNVMAGNTMILNRAAVDLVVQARPETMPPFHDWWLYALLAGTGGQVVIDAEPVLAYRQHAGGVLGAHAGMAARLTRLNLVLNGTWRGWLNAHHTALLSIDYLLPSKHRQQLSRLMDHHRRIARFGNLVRAGAHRQAPVGTAVLGLAALLGLA